MVAQGQPTWNPKPIPGRPAGVYNFSYLFTPYTHPTLGLHDSNPFLLCTHTDPLNLTRHNGRCCPSSVLHSGQFHVPFPGAFGCTQVKLHFSRPCAHCYNACQGSSRPGLLVCAKLQHWAKWHSFLTCSSRHIGKIIKILVDSFHLIPLMKPA